MSEKSEELPKRLFAVHTTGLTQKESDYDTSHQEDFFGYFQGTDIDEAKQSAAEITAGSIYKAGVEKIVVTFGHCQEESSDFLIHLASRARSQAEIDADNEN